MPRISIYTLLCFAVFFCQLTSASEYERFKIRAGIFENILQVQLDGRYSSQASLNSRLQLMRMHYTEMTSRQLWNHLAILLIGLESMNPSSATVVRWKKMLTYMIDRVSPLQKQPTYVDPEINRQIDFTMLTKLNHHLTMLLNKPNRHYHDHHHTSLESHMQHRDEAFGVYHMYKSLFNAWRTPTSVIQLITRSYLPFVFILHSIHDHNDICSYDYFTNFYSPLHESIVERNVFENEIGSARDYELALTYVDSGLWYPLSEGFY